MSKKFTKGYVDTVIRMFGNDLKAARDFLRHDLYLFRNQITREHYYEMYEYITKSTEGRAEA